MSKPKVATKEFVINYAANRWQLNFKRNVGPTSESIRKCRPKSLEEWKEYYFSNVRSRGHIQGLGERLHSLIKNVLPQEKRFHPDLIKEITLEDCIDFMYELVLNRTYQGYVQEVGN